MKCLFIVKDVIEDKDLSNPAFTVWSGLRNIMVKDVKQYFVSYNYIGYSLYGRKPTRYELDTIKQGFNELADNGQIGIVEKYSSNEFVVDLTTLYYEEGYFSNIRDDEMQRILNLKTRHDKYKILRYFACQVGSFNHSLEEKYAGKVGGMSLSYFSNVLGYSVTSLIEYNKVLMDAKLLCVYNHGDFYQIKNEKGQSQLREVPNTYCRYEDKDIGFRYASKSRGYKEQEREWVVRTENASRHRSLGQKLRAFNGGKEYDIDTIKELYGYARFRNEVNQKTYEHHISKGNKPSEPEFIDLTPFDEYLPEILADKED